VAVSCLLRECEVFELDWSKITVVGDIVEVFALRAKRTGPKMESKFYITEKIQVDLVKSYIAKFPVDARVGRFFRKIDAEGKGTQQKIGINKVASYPCQIAEFLGLTTPELYTGHCFRRSGATLLANSGCSVLELKQAGNWRSSTVAETYVANSDSAKLNIAKRMKVGNDRAELEQVVTTTGSTTASGATYQQLHLVVDMRNARNSSFSIAGPHIQQFLQQQTSALRTEVRTQPIVAEPATLPE